MNNKLVEGAKLRRELTHPVQLSINRTKTCDYFIEVPGQKEMNSVDEKTKIPIGCHERMMNSENIAPEFPFFMFLLRL